MAKRTDKWSGFGLNGRDATGQNRAVFSLLIFKDLVPYLKVQIMKGLIFIFAVVLFQEVPLKSTEEFAVKLDYQFRPRPSGDHNTVRLGESVKEYQHRAGGGVLPYLILDITLHKLVEPKMRMRTTTNIDDRASTKKVEPGDIVRLDMGFTVDMIDRVSAHEYILTFLDASREPVEKIVISVDEDGSFFVNGEKRGKF